MYVAILLMAETRDSSDKHRENCQGCLGIVSFLSLAPKKGRERKSRRFGYLPVCLVICGQQTDLPVKMDGCKHLLVCSASDRSQDDRLSFLREHWLPTFGNEVTESWCSDFGQCLVVRGY